MTKAEYLRISAECGLDVRTVVNYYNGFKTRQYNADLIASTADKLGITRGEAGSAVPKTSRRA